MSTPASQQAEIDRLKACLKAANAQAEHFEREWYLCCDEVELLALATQEKREWVGLTDEEFHDLQIEHLDDPWSNFKAIEAKLKEKNT